MIELATADSRVRKSPPPIAFIATLGEAGVTVTLRYWTSDKDSLRTKIDLVGLVKRRFDEQGLSFSAPQPA